MRSSAPIVVVGDVMVDVVAAAAGPLAHASDTDARVRWTGGGAAANVAAWLASEGVAVALVARAGADVAGRGAVAELRDAGVVVHVALDGERATGTCVVVIGADGERTMLPDRGANLALAPEDVPAELFVAGGHLHLSGYVLLHDGPRAAGLAALDHAREAGMTISVDPASAAPLAACGVERVLEWIGGVDLLLPNLDEARVLTWRGGARSGGTGAGRACGDARGDRHARRFGSAVDRRPRRRDGRGAGGRGRRRHHRRGRRVRRRLARGTTGGRRAAGGPQRSMRSGRTRGRPSRRPPLTYPQRRRGTTGPR